MKKFDPQKTVFLIDGSSFLYRAYYGLRPLHDAQGNQVQAVFGFIRMIKKLIDTFSPSYMVLVWDSPGKTARHELFQEYKATRQAPPSDLFAQKEIICEFADAIGLKQIRQVGVEADDLMYTVATDMREAEYEVVLVTSDKDMGQLLDEHTYMYDSFKQEFHDAASLTAKLGFAITKLPFYYALLGDSSDNIPGVRGIGEKGALELVTRFESLEDLYARLDDVPSARMRTALETHKDNAFLSRELFLLRRYPCNLQAKDVAFKAEQWAQARELFERLNFKSLLKELPPVAAEPQAGQADAPAGQLSLFGSSDRGDKGVAVKKKVDNPGYKTVTTSAEFDRMIALLQEKKLFAFDTETTGINPLVHPIVGISFATDAEHAWYVPFGHQVQQEQLAKSEVIERLRPLLEDPAYKKIAHHASFDVAVLRRAGIYVRGVSFDTMIAARLVNTLGQKAGLKDLSERYLGQPMLNYQEVVTNKGYKHFGQVPLEEATPYAAADARQTLLLYPVLQQALQKEGLLKLYETMEQPLLELLLTMEQEGISLDTQRLATLGKQVTQELIALEDAVIQAAGPKFAGINLNSPKQVQELLFQELQLPTKKKSAKGAYSTDSEVLAALADLHPIPGMIAKYRELAKLKNTYIEALPTYIDSLTGKVHTTFNQSSVATGRLSSSDPNLQNIPADVAGYGIEIRAAFRPQEGHLYLSADYSQIELRVMAYLSQDPALKRAFAQGEDIHTQTAGHLFDLPLEQVTHAQRQIGKRINFSVLYGMTPYGLSQDLHIPLADAKRYIETYFNRYPGVKVWMDAVVAQAKEDGFVTTLYGRRRYLPALYEANQTLYQEAVRVAVNTVVQGTAADIMKIGMIELARQLREQAIPAKMLLQIHDELLLSVPFEHKDRAELLSKEVLSTVVAWDIPLEVTTRSGSDWKEVTK